MEWVTVEEQYCWRGVTEPQLGWRVMREVEA
jgi:hypothetical protein